MNRYLRLSAALCAILTLAGPSPAQDTPPSGSALMLVRIESAAPAALTVPIWRGKGDILGFYIRVIKRDLLGQGVIWH